MRTYQEKEGYTSKKTLVSATEYITLDQFLKEVNVIGSGGQAKWYLADNSVSIDGELENHCERKLYAGMMIEIPEEGTFFMVKNGNGSGDATK